MRRKVWLWLCICWLAATLPVMAHVQNENSLYSDIEFSEAKEEIVLLHGIQAISLEGGVNLYRPFDLLTRSTLAYWSGKFLGLGGPGASANEIREAALRDGLVESLEGHATYGDVSQAYFAGQASVEEASSTLSREAFALYMGTFFTDPVGGMTLFDMAGYEPGPTGLVEEVESSSVTEGGSSYDVYRIAVGGVWYQVSHHPKILNGPVDLTQWVDKMVEASWYAPVSGDGGEKQLEIIKVGEAQFTPEEIAVIDEGAANGEIDETTNGGITSKDNDEAVAAAAPVLEDGEDPATTTIGIDAGLEEARDREPGRSVPIALIIGGVLLIIIVLWFLVRRK